ncbi:Ferritin-like domain [Rubrobacter radiotolerans]|uniref:Ferritin-like domain n=1 Tax=Rubrobacter radiotolerans TaxID=42256 RepID=A0A023X345_RUBRA|nr:ferritin-like domain-containing protein [Rubrobacter radiotolerans]AHY46892.1 Ferritin-like domain [Rubrobacter radiotolerans]MDX5894297.1 ferritin-like domain-containing protein [Rubrobacter radiotolerans]SMC05671.1 Ferritin-like domain-containing protein [Rubrobacter radiotolerans DSM 5868]
MPKHEIQVPSAEDFVNKPRSRKQFFGALAAASLGAVGGGALLSGRATAQSSGNVDVDIANFALTLEYLEAEFYTRAVDSGVLSEATLPTVTNLRDHEVAHAEAIVGLLEGVGAAPVEKPEFTFPADAFSSEAAILELAATFEPVGVGAYLGAAPLIESPDVLAAAGSIAGVEGEHVVAVNQLLGVVPPANQAFPAALTRDEVLAAVAPFLGMDAMMDTGGQAL